MQLCIDLNFREARKKGEQTLLGLIILNWLQLLQHDRIHK